MNDRRREAREQVTQFCCLLYQASVAVGKKFNFQRTSSRVLVK